MNRRLSRPGAVRRLVVILSLSLASCAVATASASAALKSHGQLLRLAPPGLRVNANSSSNWFGYNQGTLEQGSTLFNSITGDWTVPAATQHSAGTG
jgi:hypothetical protein